jgi:cell volume regulation protein A
MSLPQLFGMLGGLLVLAYAANRLFQWTRVPDVIVLLIVGVTIGPLTHLVSAEQFTDATRPIGTLALILILFGGGLELNIREVLKHFPGGVLLGVLAYAGTTGVIGFVISRGYQIPVSAGLLVGAVLGCTSATIVMPILEQWKVSNPVKVTLMVEASLGDVLAVVTVGLLLGLRTSNQGIIGAVFGSLTHEIGVAVLVAAAAGFAWSRLLPKISTQSFWQVLTFGMVLLLYAGTEAIHASGLLAVLGFGLALANFPGPPAKLREAMREDLPLFVAPHKQIHLFHNELAFLVRTYFFVLMGVVVKLEGFLSIWGTLLLLLGIIFLVRWAAVQGSRWAWHGVSPEERKTILWVLPRGLITIVLALEVSQVLGPEIAFLPDMAFAIILLTNLIIVGGGLRLPRAEKIAPTEALPSDRT